ncbi:MAG: UvrB/UvrC motif-containing protein [Oscillospiraceae bacterium]|nr:UvrB/UvrC motif-containing protein [Oscillospiraceae bacterium]
MKCQKCGRNEVNVYCASSVNGMVTETQLCGACAAGEGYDMEHVFDRFFDAMPQMPAISEGFMDAFADSFMDGFAGGPALGFIPFMITGRQTGGGCGLGCQTPHTDRDFFPFTRGFVNSNDARAKGCGRANGGCASVGKESNDARANDIPVDDKLKARRELNAQMREAVQNEEFEKAAQLRDKIKELGA